MKKKALTILCFLIYSGMASASSLTLDKAASNLDPFIQSVSMCGQWKHNNEEGSFRIIYGWLWGHTEIYVQWIANPIWYPENGQNERRVPLIMKTVSFPEFNNYEAATDLENIKCIQRNGKWIITADADNANEENENNSKYQLVIHLYNEPGMFNLEKIMKSNKSSKVDAAKRRGAL